MKQREVIKIFLASPSDVPKERRSVKKVIEELNGHLAAAHNILFEVISSERVRPGFGKDGQALVNEQIARMSEYALFIAIMWKRIGTPTPRASSGTVEEYKRARRSLTSRGNPEIWFYFRKPQTTFKTKEEERQQKAVLRFRNRIRTNGLFRDYTTPTDFEQQVRNHLTQWILDRKQARTSKGARPTHPPSQARTISVPKTEQVRPPKQRSGTTPNGNSIDHPESWIQLNNDFFKTVSSPVRSGKTVTLQIDVPDRDQVASLRALDPHNSYARKQVMYVDNIDVTLMDVGLVSVVPKAKSTIIGLELEVAAQQPHQNSLGGIALYGRYTSDEIATMHARLLLLGQQLPADLGHWFPQLYLKNQGFHDPIKEPIFPRFKKTLKGSVRTFLPKAWLHAFYYLKMTHIIDDIRVLKLGLIKKNQMQVQFQGVRNQGGRTASPTIIEVVGTCILDQ